MINSIFPLARAITMVRKLNQLYIKELLLLIAIFSNHQVIVERFDEFETLKDMVLYIILFFCFFATAIITAYIKNNPIRIAYACLYFIAFVFLDTYSRVMGGFLTYPGFISMMKASGFASEAIAEYAGPLIHSGFFGCLMFLGISLPSRKHIRLPQYVVVSSPLLAVGALTLLLFARGGDGGKALPSMFTPIAYANLYAYERINNEVGERQSVTLQPRPDNKIQDIVFVIDESVRGDFLDINADYGVDSKLEDSSGRWKITNFGIAAPIATCSSEVNVTLRYGGTRKKYQKMIDSFPSIWAFAQKAGFKTVYIDSQRTGGKLQNEMTPEEIKSIDDFVQFNDAYVVDRDILAARKIAELSRNEEREFILVNKIGAHFPIHDKYPDQFMVYQPVLKRGSFLNISDTGSREGFDGDKDWELYRNSYKNTLLWNVGEFFSILQNEADFSNVTLIYTSDHGQNLHLDGSTGVDTHCSGENAGTGEAVVPLVVIEDIDRKTLNWDKYITQNFDNSSHYNIFPTLLLLMNYDRSEVTAIYGRPLDEELNDPYTFNARFNARLGKKPIWKRIKLELLLRASVAHQH